mmetsp:Transcript_28780/g.80470  ORF Transcript_28780/g.80470 Transcript_28780/m.80470 type:complete len:82 (+) Transcript_28780:1286-1531(+)
MLPVLMSRVLSSEVSFVRASVINGDAWTCVIAALFAREVFITNQVVADPGGAMFIADTKKPIGGPRCAVRPFPGVIAIVVC